MTPSKYFINWRIDENCAERRRHGVPLTLPPCPPLFSSQGDTEVFFDLKKFLEESKASVPPELARHEASKTKPGAVDGRREKIQYAKK